MVQERHEKIDGLCNQCSGLSQRTAGGRKTPCWEEAGPARPTALSMGCFLGTPSRQRAGAQRWVLALGASPLPNPTDFYKEHKCVHRMRFTQVKVTETGCSFSTIQYAMNTMNTL